MPLLPCPSCDQKIAVVVSQAGSEITCPGCQKEIQIPNLGDLKRLGAAQAENSGEFAKEFRGKTSPETNAGRRVLFAGLMAIAGTAVIIGIFCFVRYLAIQVPATTETHIAEIDGMYHQVSAAQLVREWQQMEKYGLDVAAPYQYKKLAIEKASWGRNSLIALVVFVLCGGVATVIARSDSRSQRTQTTPTPTISS
jgi:hypothetical protein